MPESETASLPVNPHIAALPVYNAGMNAASAREISGRRDVAALASNENPNRCSPKVIEALTTGLDPSRYSDPACTALKAALGAFLSVAVDQIVVGNGSEELIAAISRAVLVEGATAVTIAPSFGLHELDPLAAGGRVVKVPMTPDLNFDIGALQAAIREEPRLVFLSSPSNPVGRALERDQLKSLIDAVGPQSFFVLDEAYFEFTGDDIPDGIALLHGSGISYAVLRTFSKAYGLAGLRVGYAVCSSPGIARLIGAATPPFNVNAAAQVAAIAALGDQDWMRASVRSTIAERDRVTRALTELGLFVVPSQGNFLFVRTALDSVRLFDALLAEGIIVKPWREAGYEHFVRASIGTPEENDRLIAALKQTLDPMPPR
jgi:histidinol-phosphate aminotransferase